VLAFFRLFLENYMKRRKHRKAV